MTYPFHLFYDNIQLYGRWLSCLCAPYQIIYRRNFVCIPLVDFFQTATSLKK